MTRESLTAVLIALLWVAALTILHWNNWKLDTTALYFAAKSWAAGQTHLIYAPGPVPFLVEPPAQWVAWGDAENWDEPRYFTPYLYPPIWAVLLAPIAAAVPSVAFFNATLLAMIAASIWLVWIGWRFIRPVQTTPVVWAGLSFLFLVGTAPGYMLFGLGQPQIIVSAVTFAAFLALANGRDILSGGLLALVAAVKLSPALLVVIFIMEKRWKALGAFAVIGAALGGLSVALAGWPLHAELLEKLAQIEERTLVSRINTGLELVLYQVSEIAQGRADWVIGTPEVVMEAGWITWTTRAVLAAGLVLIWWTSRDVASRLRIWLRLLAVLLLTTITNPLGWVHYLVLPFVMLPGLLELMDRKTAWRVIALTFIAFSMPVYLALNMFGAGDWVQVGLNFGVPVALIVVTLFVARAEANPERYRMGFCPSDRPGG
ncbi:MAG TPA: hypothetical protein DEO85_13515 [Maritimibacter sp.]|nr:hypothetical protein [Maritimibacter sp.]